MSVQKTVVSEGRAVSHKNQLGVAFKEKGPSNKRLSLTHLMGEN
jgi:hypothetical protein